jgi:hypothetical protein
MTGIIKYAWREITNGYARVSNATGEIVAEIHCCSASRYGPHTYGTSKFIDVESAKKACEKDWP